MSNQALVPNSDPVDLFGLQALLGPRGHHQLGVVKLGLLAVRVLGVGAIDRDAHVAVGVEFLEQVTAGLEHPLHLEVVQRKFLLDAHEEVVVLYRILAAG